MAAYITRSLSMMPGGGEAASTMRNTNGDARLNQSPLQIFVNAKKQINDIFLEIENYVEEAVDYIHDLKDSPVYSSIASKERKEALISFKGKVASIRGVLRRDHMKVTFFGRTSNGKSTVINAMLRDKILPSGIGHTTNCFLQVEGSENGESYLITEGSDVRQNVKSVAQLGHALCKEKLTERELVRIYWPRDKCLLLRDDVVFVDSPGIDVTPNLDEWIDSHCLDADVFVLVANAESTLMLAEKNFFHKVSTRLSKPNIFVLNNRWDASASEPEFLDDVRAQHLERAVDFLVRELKVCSTKEAHERIFFVSAKEVLQARMQEQKGMAPHTGALADGFPKRYLEFQDFEKKFEECISKSAVKTKFEQHSQRGKSIAHEIHTIMDEIYEEALEVKSYKDGAKKEVGDKYSCTEDQLRCVTKEMKKKIESVVVGVEEKVSMALNDEIRRLAVLVGDFDTPFHPEPIVLNIYKKEMHKHVEKGLGQNLRGRLSTELSMNIGQAQQEMTERMSLLLPSDKRQVSVAARSQREPFEILYRLNCDNLCADFHEDLEFRFSWGITSMISRFLGSSGHKVALSNYNSMSAQMGTPDYSVERLHNGSVTSSNRNEDYLSIASRIALSSLSQHGTMGGLLVAGFTMKTVGWRLILASGAIYGCIYLYERLTWTNKAKERQFKRQYVDHATKKLKLIVDLTSANCSHQVQQELSSTFARQCQLVDQSMTDMSAQIKDLDSEIRLLEEAGNAAKVLRNKANYVTNELQLFEDKYLKQYQ